MNLDWKARFRNKTFWVAIISAIILLIQQLGFGDYLPQNIMDIVNTILTILVMLGIVIDPSSKGINDPQKPLPSVPLKELPKEQETKSN